jgi:RimJ/RimL family protein N-acetyltransferase
MELLPIQATLEENAAFLHHPDCQESLGPSVDFFKSVGYDPPWIGYYAHLDGQLVGVGAFKGRPVGGQVEIAYGTFERFQQQGIGTEICRQLVLLSLQTDTSVRITARTLPENNFSTRVLEKNGFHLLGIVFDKDDGDVWEWTYRR